MVKFCPYDNLELVRRPFEDPDNFRRRKYCTRKCFDDLRRGKPQKRHAAYIEAGHPMYDILVEAAKLGSSKGDFRDPGEHVICVACHLPIPWYCDSRPGHHTATIAAYRKRRYHEFCFYKARGQDYRPRYCCVCEDVIPLRDQKISNYFKRKVCDDPFCLKYAISIRHAVLPGETTYTANWRLEKRFCIICGKRYGPHKTEGFVQYSKQKACGKKCAVRLGQMKLGRRISDPPPGYVPRKSMCIIPGCTHMAAFEKKKLCFTHISKQRRETVTMPTCLVDGCETKAQTFKSGMCAKHRRHADSQSSVERAARAPQKSLRKSRGSRSVRRP